MHLVWKWLTPLTGQPFWLGRPRYPDVCHLGWWRTHVRCCWSLLCWSTPIPRMEAGSWCGGQSARDYKPQSSNYTGIHVSCFMCAAMMTNARWPSPRPEWPYPGGRTWSDPSRPAGCLLWTLRHSRDGLQSRSVEIVRATCAKMELHIKTSDWESRGRESRQSLDTARRLTPTLIFTWVLLRSHFSRGLEGVNSDTSLPSSSRMREFSCLMTCRGHFSD